MKTATLSLLLASLLVLVSCAKKAPEDAVLARVGLREFTRGNLEAWAGMPMDSLPETARWRILETWIERTLVDLEGDRRGLDRDRDLVEKLAALKSDLYLSRLLSEGRAGPPPDTTIENYYRAHQPEFLRPTDAYLIDLYSAEDINALGVFRLQLLQGDTTVPSDGSIVHEGRWLAESGELDPDLEHELEGLEAGQITEPRPFGDGYRIIYLLEAFPAGTVLHLDAVRDEIVQRLLIAESRQRRDDLMSELRQRFPVEVMVKDSL